MVTDLPHYLDTHMSMGPDGSHPKVLRDLVNMLSETLPVIFQQSWLTWEVPGDWRLAGVMAVYRRARRSIEEITGLSA